MDSFLICYLEHFDILFGLFRQVLSGFLVFWILLRTVPYIIVLSADGFYIFPITRPLFKIYR